MAMMDFCCQQIPQVIAVNEFSIKEIIFCMEELEKNQTVPEAKIAEWKNHLHKVSPGRSYTKFVYDLATRGLFAVLLHEGYQGKYKDVWQKALARSAIPTLEMISRK